MILTADDFAKLRRSDDAEDHRRAAVEEAPESVWREVIQRYPDLRKWVAQNKTIPPPVIAELASDFSPEVRFWIAAKRSTPPELLRRLATDPEAPVRARVAANPNCPPDLLKALSDDADPDVVSTALEAKH